MNTRILSATLLMSCLVALKSGVWSLDSEVGYVCENRANNSIPEFCKGCLDRFEGLGYNPWIKVPKTPGLLIKYKLKELEHNSCKIYNPAATCWPNRNMKGINFTMGGEGDSYLYVNYTDKDLYNFVNFTIYIQCHYHNPPFCFLLTFVDECPFEGLTMAAKISITAATSFVAIVLIVVILLVVIWMMKQQCDKGKDNNNNSNSEAKLHKYVQMD